MLALGQDLACIREGLERTPVVPGRLEPVPCSKDCRVLVDFAHTDQALKAVLASLRQVTTRRIIVVFGAGGDRDRTKRPRMAKVAEKWADSIIVTSDNPRSEEPMAIIDEVVGGFSSQGRGKVRVEPDRRKAIATAVNAAAEGDVLLIAGKGHENYQIIGQTRHHFDDVETARELLLARGLGRQGQGI
jgi:UDP-N-acetylmuramoyl-L-alanyl-D-glutamate--2,6-diaminopimelate ligase